MQLLLGSSHTTSWGLTTAGETKSETSKLSVTPSLVVQPTRLAVLMTISNPSSPRLTAGSADCPERVIKLLIAKGLYRPAETEPPHGPEIKFNSKAVNPKLIRALPLLATTFCVAVVGGRATQPPGKEQQKFAAI